LTRAPDRDGQQLPVDFPPWQTVYGWFRRWKDRGVTDRIIEELREQIRIAQGRDPQPSAGVIDSQSVKGADTVGRDTRGYDAGKTVNGRKRFIITDTLGLLVGVTVLAASWQHRDGAKTALLSVYLATPIRYVFADQGFAGRLVDWALQILAMVIEIVRKPTGQRGFEVHPKRWVGGPTGGVDVGRDPRVVPAGLTELRVVPQPRRGRAEHADRPVGDLPARRPQPALVGDGQRSYVSRKTRSACCPAPCIGTYADLMVMPMGLCRGLVRSGTRGTQAIATPGGPGNPPSAWAAAKKSEAWLESGRRGPPVECLSLAPMRRLGFRVRALLGHRNSDESSALGSAPTMMVATISSTADSSGSPPSSPSNSR
jgi:hypothetical protein